MSANSITLYSKTQINRAGETIAHSSPHTSEYKKALSIVNDWRTCHAYPMNTFQATLRRKVGKYKSPIVAQRLKRLPTIIDKLSRYPDMSLARMQDVGGVRAVVNSIDEVRAIQAEYEEASRFTHELYKKNDYISMPKPDGYRGVHLVFKYDNTLARNGIAKQYKGFAVEVQIRTKLQHTWATAVETMGTFRNESFKTDQGNKDWLEFFALVSSAFAHVEGSAPAPQHANMSALEVYKALSRLESKLDVLDQISGLSVAADAIHAGRLGGYYNIIVLDKIEKSVRIGSFTKDELSKATERYAELESEPDSTKDLVLVSAGKLKSLKLAYPNYFLDVRDFIEKVKILIEEAGRVV